MSNSILFNCDCLIKMEELVSSGIKVDAIITDPPYLIKYKTNHRKDKNHRFCSEIKNDDDFDFDKWADLADDLLCDDSPIYIFGSWKTEPIFREIFVKKWNHKNNIIWVKNNHTAGDLEAQYGQKYELIMLYNKGRSKFTGKRYTDVWEFDRVSGNDQVHQNQKPIDLLRRIISNHKIDIVLDTFMGSGSTGVACMQEGVDFIGMEMEEQFFKIAEDRIYTESMLND